MIRRVSKELNSSSGSDDTPHKTKPKLTASPSSRSSSKSESRDVKSLLVQTVQRVVDEDSLDSLPCAIKSELEEALAGIETPRWKAILAARRVCIFTARFVEWPIKEGEQFCIFPTAQRRVMTFPNDQSVFISSPYRNLSPTSVCQYNKCLRRAVLREAVASPCQYNQAMLWGMVTHKYFQITDPFTPLHDQAYLSILDQASQEDESDNALPAPFDMAAAFVRELYSLKLESEPFLERCSSIRLKVVEWYRKYLQRSQPFKAGPFQCKILEVVSRQHKLEGKGLGVTGQLDLLVRAEVLSKEGRQVCLCPLQLKTGKFYDHYIHQVQFYLALTRHHFPDQPVRGLLYSFDKDEFNVIQPSMHFLSISYLRRAKILAAQDAMARSAALPQLTLDKTSCQRCQFQRECVGYSVAIPQSENDQLQGYQDLKLLREKFTMQERAYLQLWLKLLANEEKFNKSSKELKTLRHFSLKHKQQSRYSFQRKGVSVAEARQIQQVLSPGDGVRLSRHCVMGLFQGKVSYSSYSEGQRVLQLNIKCSSELTPDSITKWKIERLDKQFYPNYRANVFALATNQPLRDLLVRGRFEPAHPQQQCADFEFMADYTPSQRAAFRKCMRGELLVLVHGMPGTGKTRLITDLVQAWSLQNLRVLVASFTNYSVDNVLLKCVERHPSLRHRIARLGNHDAIDPRAKEFAVQLEHHSAESLRLLRDRLSAVFTTILSLNHPLLQEQFDVCVVDQASQCIEPACLGPILKARRFVLVGDHFQLQPLVRNPDPVMKPMRVSLFQRLIHSFPEQKVSLSSQFRMNKEILQLCNTFVYNNSLACHNQQVQNFRLVARVQLSGQFGRVLGPEFPALMLDLDQMVLGYQEYRSRQGKSATSRRKIVSAIGDKLVLFLVRELLRGGVSPEQVVVITIYNQTLARLKKQLGMSQVEVLTVDKSQGAEKQCVILDLELIESLKEQLTENWRRLNVALTRARAKLILLGSSRSMSEQGGSQLREYMLFFQKQGWLIELPQDAISDLIGT